MRYNNPKGTWQGHWRTAAAPSANIAIGCRSVGHAIFNADWKQPDGIVPAYILYWCEEGIFKVKSRNGEIMSLDKNNILLYPPGTEIEGVPVSTSGKYRWLTFKGSLATSLIQQINLPLNKVIEGSNIPVNEFKNLEKLLNESEVESSTIAYKIITLASSNTNSQPKTHLTEVKNIIDKEFANSSLNVNLIAKRLKTHRSQLSREFMAEYKINISTCIQQKRLEHAMQLLRNTNLSIAETAYQCGYNDPSYFCYIFRKNLHYSPAAFRKTL